MEAQRLAKDLLIDEQREIRNAFNDGEQNVWNRDRDGNIFEYESGDDYFNKTYKLNHEIIEIDKEELEQDRQTENQIEQEQNKPQLLILQKNLLAKQQTYLLNIEQAFNNANYQYPAEANKDAVAFMKSQLIANEKESWIFENIGNLYADKGLYIKAESVLSKSIKISDKSQYTLNRLSSVYKSIEDEKKKISEIIVVAKSKLSEEAKIIASS